MRALDTNVLVRLVAGDDPAQGARAAALVGAAATGGDQLFVADVVVCEFVWVLRSTYKIPRPRITGALGGLLRAPYLRFSSLPRLERALAAYAAGRGDFADYLIRERALAAGCDAVVTFARALHGEPGFAPPA